MIRRIAILTGFVISSACAFGASLTPANLNGSGCLPPPSAGCVVNSAITGVQMGVSSAPAGTGPTWTLSQITNGPGLPPGIAIDLTTGLISGIPTQAGQYTFNVNAVYTSPASTVSQSYTIDVHSQNNQLVTIAPPSSLPAGTVGTAIPTALFTAAGGVPFIDGSGNPYYQWSLGPNTDGLVINAATGVLSGTPTGPGTFSIAATATDATGAHADATPVSFTATGSGTYTISITTTTLPSGVLNVPYSQSLQQSGGPSSGVVWSVSSGTLPPGLGIASNNDSSGTISGTPTSVGTYNFTVQAAFTGSASVTQALSITITSVATSLTMANPTAVTGVVGSTVTMQFTATGGTSPYTYSLVSGTPPAGLHLNTSTGAVTGPATAAGSATLTVQVTDHASNTAQATGTITISAAIPTLTLPTPAAVSGNVGQSMSPWMQFTATGGTAPYTYAVAVGSLPGGLTLNTTTGAITGQATQANTFTFIIQATDSSLPAQTASATASIRTDPLSVTGAISLTNSAGVAITPGGGVTPGTQPTVGITLGTAPPEAVTATLSVFFVRSLDGQASREVMFSSALPQFTVAAGSTQGTFANGTLALTVGTAAGTGQITVTFQDALGNTVTSANVQPFKFTIAGTPPVIQAFTLTCTGTTYTASVIGFSSTLDMPSNAVFNFTPSSTTTLTASSSSVSVAALFSAWYSTTASNQHGGQFKLDVPFTFTVSGGSSTNPLVAMTVTLTNSTGTPTVSQPANPNPACQ